MMRYRLLYCAVLFLVVSSEVKPQSVVYDALLRSSSLSEAGKAETAIVLLDKVLPEHRDYRLFLAKGEALLDINDPVQAKVCFLMASELKEHSGAFGLARSYALERNPEKSIAYLKDNLSSVFRVREREILMDSFLHRIDNSIEWRLFWETERYSEGERILEEVTYQIQRGRTPEALSLIAESGGHDSRYFEVSYADALVKYSLGDYQGAADILLSPGSKNIPPSLRDRLLADCMISMGEDRKAISLLTSLISSELPDASLYTARAESYLALSEYRYALADIDYYISLYPENGEALGLAGRICIASGDNNSALKYYNRALEANPNEGDVYVGRGDIWYAAGMWDNAISDYSMALDLNPDDDDVYLNKGLSLLRLGKTDEACFDFRMAVRMGNRKASEQYNKHCIK